MDGWVDGWMVLPASVQLQGFKNDGQDGPLLPVVLEALHGNYSIRCHDHAKSFFVTTGLHNMRK